MFSVDRQTLAVACQTYAEKLTGFLLGVDQDGKALQLEQVLWALCGNESSFGDNFTPRHEDGYCHGHIHFDAPATKLWGCWAHCSYGVTQLMFKNAGGSPLALATSLDLQLAATVTMLKRPEFKHADLDHIGRLWNGPAESEQYKADLRKHYAQPLLIPKV